MEFFEKIDPFSKNNKVNLFLKLIQNKDKLFLIKIQQLINQRLIELV
jgi:hypothetical protein